MQIILKNLLLTAFFFFVLGCNRSSDNCLPEVTILASDSLLVWSFPYEDDTLYRLWAVVPDNVQLADGFYNIYLDKDKTKKVYHGQIVNNKKEGTQTYWYTNGNKLSETKYESGKRIGTSLSWYLDGSSRIEYQYDEGELKSKIEFINLDSIGKIEIQTQFINENPSKIIKKYKKDFSIEEIYFRSNANHPCLGIKLDSIGNLIRAWTYKIDTIEEESNGEIRWLVIESQIEIDSILN